MVIYAWFTYFLFCFTVWLESSKMFMVVGWLGGWMNG